MWEVIFFIVFALLMVGSWVLMKGIARVFWMSLFAVIAALVGLTEGIAYLCTHHTISQLFWQFSLESPAKAWIIIGCLTVGWIMFMWHLAAKLLKKKE